MLDCLLEFTWYLLIVFIWGFRKISCFLGWIDCLKLEWTHTFSKSYWNYELRTSSFAILANFDNSLLMLILLFLNSGAVCGLTADDDKFLLCLTFYLDFLFDSEKIVLLEGVDFRYPENFFIRIEFQGWMLSFCISSSRSLVSLRECIRGLTI